MNHLHEEIRIEAPVEHVWAYYCDTASWPDWMPRGTCSDFSGPIDQVGTTHIQSMKLLGHEMRSKCTVVEVEPMRLYREHTDPGPMDTSIRFEPEGDATRLVCDSDWEMPGMLPGFIKDLINKGWAERGTRQMLADFKALAEARIPAHA